MNVNSLIPSTGNLFFAEMSLSGAEAVLPLVCSSASGAVCEIASKTISLGRKLCGTVLKAGLIIKGNSLILDGIKGLNPFSRPPRLRLRRLNNGQYQYYRPQPSTRARIGNLVLSSVNIFFGYRMVSQVSNLPEKLSNCLESLVDLNSAIMGIFNNG